MAKTKFVTKDSEGKELKLAILHPTDDVLAEANAVQNKIFKEALSRGALLGVALDKMMREQGLWDDAKQKKLEELAKKINDARYKLTKGGIRKSEARELAFSVIDNINEQRRLLAERSAYSSRTADGQADNGRFNYLVAACTVNDESGEKVFKSVAEYETKAGTDLGADAANKFAEIMYGLGSNLEAKNIEYVRLKQWGCMNDKLQLVREDGRLIDRSGRLVNDAGRFVNEENELVDLNGNRVDEEGNLIVEELPFLDDNDMPITSPAEEVEEEVEEELVKTE